MKPTVAIGLSLEEIRPTKHTADSAAKAAERSFPVYADLIDRLLAAPLGKPDPTARHLCAVLSTWSYSDPDTVAQMMTRMGLPENRCRYMEVSNNANSVRSSAYLVQSKCRRVVLLAYRGTDPFDVSTWAVNGDLSTVSVPVHRHNEPDVGRVHGGFYRNQRVTWYDVVTALKLAARGDSIVADLQNGEAGPPANWHGARLFITGHSLGGAMALLAAYRLMSDSSYAQPSDDAPPLQPLLHSVYTFAQPMVGNAAFASHCTALLHDRLFCHVFRGDIVPRLPPKGLGTEYKHAGKHYGVINRGNGGTEHWVWAPKPFTKNPLPADSPWSFADAAIGLLRRYNGFDEKVDRALLRLKFLWDLIGHLEQSSEVPAHAFLQAPQAAAAFVGRLAHDSVSIVGEVTSGAEHLLRGAISPWFPQLAPPSVAEPEPEKPARPSLAFHAPLNYLAASQPDERLTEFGRDF